MADPFARIPSHRRGVFAKELVGPDGSWRDAVTGAAERGLRGIFLSSPAQVSASLDGAELDAARHWAAAQGVSFQCGLGQLNPAVPGRSAGLLAFGDGDASLGLLRLARASAALGAPTPMLVVGAEQDRFAGVLPWSEQLDLFAALLRGLAPRLRDEGLGLLLKTHQELTSWEALAVVDAVGSDVCRVALDPVNLLVRMEDPVAAARRCAGLIGQVHVDDTRLCARPGELVRALVPVGDGDVPWQQLVAAIGASDPDAFWWGEAHAAELTMPYADPSWLGTHTDIGLPEVAAWLGRARLERVDSLVGDVPARKDRVVSALATR